MTKPQFKVKIEDLVPAPSEFTLEGKTYHLRKFSIEDEAWMRRTWKPHETEKYFAEMDMAKLSLLLYRLLVEKSDFPPVEIEDHDDDGNVIKRKLTGPQNLCRQLPGGILATQEIMFALSATIGVSQPILDALTKEEIENQMAADKKKEKPGKKSQTDRLTGEKSSKSSQPTDTP